MIILDTNVLSEMFRSAPSQEVEMWLAHQDAGAVFFTAVGEAELRHGVAILPEGRRRDALAEAIDGMLEEEFRGRILPFARGAARAYALIAADRRVAGRPMSQFDCQIAGIARSVGASVATCNVRDNEGCGIVLINPWEKLTGR